MSLSFRRADEADAPVILELIRALAAEEQRPQAATISLAGVKALISDPSFGAVVHVACGAQGAVVGYMMTAALFSSFKGAKVLYLEDIVLAASVRGQGHGRRLMGFLAGYALAHGYASMQWSAQAENTGAVAFYAKMQAAHDASTLKYSAGAELLACWAAGAPSV